jgi:hypothetical protein
MRMFDVDYVGDAGWINEFKSIGDKDQVREFKNSGVTTEERVLLTNGSKVTAKRVDVKGDREMVTYAHKRDPMGIRFRQFSKDKLPKWAVNIKAEIDDKPKDIYLSSLSTLASAKWFLQHELIRHEEDIVKIKEDLAKLKDIKLPEDVLRVLGSKFIIPERG